MTGKLQGTCSKKQHEYRPFMTNFGFLVFHKCALTLLKEKGHAGLVQCLHTDHDIELIASLLKWNLTWLLLVSQAAFFYCHPMPLGMILGEGCCVTTQQMAV